jgi:tetratricopeptide (TPR) repeat protein
MFALALQEHKAGKVAEAEALYRDVLARDPQHFDSLHLLGVAALQRGRHDVAIDMIGKALALNDRISTFHNNFAEALRGAGRMEEAVAHARRAIELEPGFAEAHLNLGNALKQLGRSDEAVEQYRRALALNPAYAEAHVNLGIAQMDGGQVDEAIESYRRALALRPDFAAAEMNLGIALHRKHAWDDAVAHYERALALVPNYILAHLNLGDTLFEQGLIDAAVARYERALHISTNGRGPDSRSVRPAESLAMMSTGGRPLYPVEDKCVMSLVRTHCWRAPLNEWESLAAGALTHKGLCAESRYELAIRTAIQQWVNRDYTGLSSSLDTGDRLLGELQVPNANVHNSRAYAGFLRALLAYMQQNPQSRSGNGQVPLPVIGDSHCLTYDGTTVAIDGRVYVVQGHLIMGCKAWHLGNAQPNRFKWLFEKILEQVAPNSTVVCAFGEIDCRLDEGILPHYRKAGGDLAQLVTQEAENYVRYVAHAAAGRSVHVLFLGVPAPNIAGSSRYGHASDEDKSLLVDAIRLFNAAVERAATAAGHRYVDVYTPSAGAGGTASGRLHLEDVHLRPDALQLALG